MEPQPVDIFHLQRRDLVAWSTLLGQYSGYAGTMVTAVETEPLPTLEFIPSGRITTGHYHHIRRYILTLADVSDPITFIAKRTNRAEALMYELFGTPPATALPACLYVHRDGDDCFVILEDVPDHFPPHAWKAQQMDDVAATLAKIHAAHWARDTSITSVRPYQKLPFSHFHQQSDEDSGLFAEVDADDSRTREYLSDQATRSVGRLSPLFERAAIGLEVMQSLNGWHGVLNENQMASVADLLDDPVPMLNPLLDLPITLLHGAPHPHHWRSTLFNQYFLIDWSCAQLGPGILDLMALLEGIALDRDYSREGQRSMTNSVQHSPSIIQISEQAVIDTYLLTLATELGDRTVARAFRGALPAARCLHIVLTWFSFFATWADDIPDPYFWRLINQLSDAELRRYHGAPAISLRHYLAGAFERLLLAYRNL